MYRIQGTVIDRNADGTYNVKIKVQDKEYILRCFVAGKLKYKFRKVRIENGDTVIVEVTPYDLTKGKIVKRIR